MRLPPTARFHIERTRTAPRSRASLPMLSHEATKLRRLSRDLVTLRRLAQKRRDTDFHGEPRQVEWPKSVHLRPGKLVNLPLLPLLDLNVRIETEVPEFRKNRNVLDLVRDVICESLANISLNTNDSADSFRCF